MPQHMSGTLLLWGSRSSYSVDITSDDLRCDGLRRKGKGRSAPLEVGHRLNAD
jgi:hypothetical protein